MNNEINSKVEMLDQKTEELMIKTHLEQGLPLSNEELLQYICHLERRQVSLQLMVEQLTLAKDETAIIAANKYAELYNSAQLGYFTLSKASEIIELNLFASQLLGKECFLLKNSRFDTYISDNSKPIFNQFLGKISNNKQREICEITLSNRGNLPMFIQLTGTASSNGEQCFISATDITDRKRAEEAMVEADGKFWALFENGPIAVAYHEMIYNDLGKPSDYRFIDANESYLELTGIDPRGKTVKQAFPGIEKESFDWIGTYGKVAISGKSIRFEQYLQFNNRWYDCVAYQYKPNHFVSAFLEITKRKRAEQALKESALKFRTVADQTFDWLYWLSENQQIIYMSPACKKITGYDPEEFISNPARLSQIVHPDDSVAFLEHNKQIFLDENKNEEYDLEIRVISKSGSLVWISHICRPIFDENGKYLGRRICNRDITEKKNMVADLIKAKEQAEESDRLKTAFLANMSHEIRTPMNGILGFAQLLKEPNLTGDQQQEFITIIQKSGARMLNIINDIISISKVEAGQMEIYISETNVNKQIDYLYTFFKPEAEQKGLQLVFKKPLSSKEAILNTDKEKIYAILTNLVKNAIKFTPTGSIEFGYERKDKYLEFFVRDSGQGISQEQKEFIFERFRQGSESNSRNYEGAGLGLTISKAYVEMLGGKIWVESIEGKGTIFYFTIPYLGGREEKKHIKVVDPAVKSENPISNIKILIAEDDDISAKLLSITLRMHSNEILVVKNGIEAVETCGSNPDLDLILMDIKMPLMDGYEATKQIRKFNTEVVIIAQSAFALTGDQEKAIEAGCNDYITKPIKKKYLIDMIKKHFKK
jgi:PAS domain S-box-containing protein